MNWVRVANEELSEGTVTLCGCSRVVTALEEYIVKP
jgi:hypothetical protein